MTQRHGLLIQQHIEEWLVCPHDVTPADFMAELKRRGHTVLKTETHPEQGFIACIMRVQTL